MSFNIPLTQHLQIFKLYHGSQFYWWRILRKQRQTKHNTEIYKDEQDGRHQKPEMTGGAHKR
jgi:hypothetical protein